MIIVARLTEHVDHAVDRGGAANHFAAWIVQAPTVEAGLRLGFEQPVGTWIADRKKIANRDVKPDPVVFAARLQKQYAFCRISRQSVAQHAAGRARTHDDVVELAFDRLCVRHSLPLTEPGLYPGRQDLLGL